MEVNVSGNHLCSYDILLYMYRKNTEGPHFEDRNGTNEWVELKLHSSLSNSKRRS